MLRTILFEACRLILLLLAVSAAAFFLMKASPIDPIDAYLGAAIASVGPEQKVQIAQAWGLDQPPVTQYLLWLSNLLSGDLGHSTLYNSPVSEVVMQRLSASLLLTGLAWVFSGSLGVALGAIAAVKGGWIDWLIRFYCYLLAATPTFWLAIVLLTVFSVALGWTPICCAGPIGVPADEVTWGQHLWHLILPLAALSLFGVAQVALHARAKLLEVMASDYARFARTQGAGEWDILWHHGLRNASFPILTVLMASMSELIGGAILAEQVFAWPGLGRATVEAGLKGDVALLLAIALLTSFVVAFGNRLADLSYRLIDPRMRVG